MGKEEGDYAVRAAREWFAKTQEYISTIEDVPYLSSKSISQQYLDEAVQKLAAIIRKHVGPTLDELEEALENARVQQELDSL